MPRRLSSESAIVRARSFALSLLLIATSTFTGIPVVGTRIAAAEELDPVAPVGTYADLVAAINAANGTPEADTITLSDGTTIVLEATLPTITEPLTIDGAGATLDGDDTYPILQTSTDGTFRDLLLSGSFGSALTISGTAAVTIENVTFTDNTAGMGDGGAIYNTSSGPVQIVSSRFLRNTSFYDGGAIRNGDGTNPTLLSITGTELAPTEFIENTAGVSGGAVANGSNASLAIAGPTRFEGNVAGAGGNGGGGAINSAQLASLSLTDATFVGNRAADGGGALFLETATTVGGSTFIGNSTTPGGGFEGGAIAIRLADLVVRDSTFVGNRAGSGGAVWTAQALTVENSSFVDNTAATGSTGSGGALFGSEAVTVSDSTFLRNIAPNFGGAVSGGRGTPYFDAVVVSGSTFTGNRAAGPEGNGGAVFAAADLMILDSTFAGNHSGTYNGGGAVSGGFVAVTDGTFTGNSAGDDGGGAIRSSGSVSVVTSMFSGNSVRQDGGPGGGAIYAVAAVSVTSSDFSSNSAVGSGGGGAFRADGPATVVDSTFTTNQVNGSGGAITASSTSVTRSTFDRNSAGDDGGAIAGGPVTLDSSTLIGNSASRHGGALNVGRGDAGAALAATNTTFDANTAGGDGGTIRATGPNGADGSVELTNVTLRGSGALVYLTAGSGGTTTLSATDSLLVGGSCLADTTTSTRVNLATDASCPGDLTTATAIRLAASAADNDGPTKTIRLLPGSLAIDASPLVGDACATATDQRGQTRPVGAACDLGAFELRRLPSSVVSLSTGDETSFVYGTTVTAQVVVEPTLAADTVEFTDDQGRIAASCQLVGGTCSVALTDLSVGTYVLTADYRNDPYYEATSGTVTFDVTKATLAVDAVAATKTYGDADPAFSYTLSGFVPGDDATNSGISGAAACARTNDDETAGTYPGVVECTAGTLLAPNYAFAAGAAAAMTIDPRPITITASDGTKVYGQSDPALGWSITSGSLAAADAVTGSVGRISGETVGTYDVTQGTLAIGGAGSLADYTLTFLSGELEITPATVTATLTAANKTYDGTAGTTATCTLTGVLDGDTVVCTATNATFDEPTAGTYLVTADVAISGDDAGNYELASPTASDEATINQRAITATVTVATKTYDASTGATISDCNVVGALAGAAVDCTSGTAVFADASAGSGKAVSASGLTLVGADAGNYSFAGTATGTGTILQKRLTAAVVVAEKVYDRSTGGTITACAPLGVIGAEDVDCAGGTATFASATVGAGIAVQVTGLTLVGTANLANYAFDGTAATTADITTATVTATLTAADKTYDGTAGTTATCTLTGVLDGDTVVCTATNATFADASAGSGKAVTAHIAISGADATNYRLASPTATDEATIGTLRVTATIVVPGKTYDASTGATISDCTVVGALAGAAVDCTGGAAAFATASAGTGKPVSASGLTLVGADAGNYAFDGTAATTATISKVTLVVTPDAKARTYGDPVPTYTFTVAGWVGGETTGSAAGYSNPVCTSAYAPTTSVTASPVTISCSAGTATNYDFHVDATAGLAIAAKQLTVTPAGTSVTYGDAAPAYTYTVTGFVNGETTGSAAGYANPTCTSGYLPTSPVASSPLEISCVGGSATNYTWYTAAKASLMIAAKELTVTPAAKSVTYGDAAPTYTYTVTGFANGETTGSAAGYSVPSCTSDYGPTTPVAGSPRTISCSGGSAANYTFATDATAGLTIARAHLTVTPAAKSVTYGDAAPTYTYTVTGWVNGETTGSAAGYSVPSCTSDYGPTTPVAGSPRTISCSGGFAANYTFNTDATAGLAIAAKVLTVTPDAKSVTYGDTVPTYTYTVTGFANGETTGSAAGYAAPVCTSDYGPTTPVASSPLSVTCTGGSAANYSWYTAATANLTIAKATLTVAPDAKSKLPGTADPALTYTLTGFRGSDDSSNSGITGSGACTRATGTSSGTYAITCTVGTLAAPNYSFVAGSPGTFTILRTQVISWLQPSGLLVGRTVTLTGVATSSLTVAYESETPSVCSVSGAVINGESAGTCRVVARQAGNALFAAAPELRREFLVYATRIRPTMTQSFVINGEVRKSIPIYVKYGTQIEMRLRVDPRMVGETFEVWWQIDLGTWQKLTTRKVETASGFARYTFRATRPSVAYKWKWAGNVTFAANWSAARRVYVFR